MTLTRMQRETIINAEALTLQNLIKITCSDKKEKSILLQGVVSFNDRLLTSLHEARSVADCNTPTPLDIWRELQTVRHNNYLLQKTISEVALAPPTTKCPLFVNPGDSTAEGTPRTPKEGRPHQPEGGKEAEASPKACPTEARPRGRKPKPASGATTIPAVDPTPQLFLKAIEFLIQLKEQQEAKNNSNN